MGFYFFNTGLFSIAWLVIAYLAAMLVFGAVWWLTRKVRGRVLIWTLTALLLLLAPVSEELWIARNFAQACKDAGTFINKKVQVDGFYDDTAGWGPRQLAESQYKFMESRDILKHQLIRVEPADNSARDRALAWHAEMLRSKRAAEGPFIVQVIGDQQIVVAPNRIDAWRVMTIDRPTARYHFRWNRGADIVAHKIGKTEYVVVDTESNEVIARYTTFGRNPPWFFIGPNNPISCARGGWPSARGNPLVYRDALRAGVK